MKRQTKIRLYSMLAATIIGATSLSGCNTNQKEMATSSISDEYSNYDDFAMFRLRKARAEMCYRGENIFLAIDKNTNDVTRYICDDIFRKNEVYELETGEMIYYSDNFFKTYGEEKLENIINSSYIVNFIEIGNYIEGETCRQWYTLEEIKALESQILDVVLKIKESEKTLIKTK